MIAEKNVELIEQYNTTLVPAYVAALRQDYATLGESRRNPVPHAEAHERRIEVQDQMQAIILQVQVPFYINPDTLQLIEGVIPARDGFVSCLIFEGQPYGYMYLDADNYDAPIGLEGRIIGEECR